MKKILLGAFAALALAATTGAVVVAAGVIDVGADTPHHPAVHQLLSFARERSIARRTADIAVPADLATPERLRRGAGNYQAMCVDCHLAPELADSEIRRGLYPRPPNLSLPDEPAPPTADAARQFWIVKHGIKASGMPAWAQGGIDDAAIWDLVAVVQALPTLSAAAYGQLVVASDGHRHGGLAVADRDRPPPAVAKPASHDHAAHDHGKHRH